MKRRRSGPALRSGPAWEGFTHPNVPRSDHDAMIRPVQSPIDPSRQPIRGRGAAENPPNRFEALHVVREEGPLEGEEGLPQTQFFKDTSRTILARNDSPDIPFEVSLNPYRGCEHGCIYCFARPSHEYLGFSAGLDFETKIMVKLDAPQLLRKELSSRRWEPKAVSIGTNTDAYQPIERKLELTRRCLEVFLEFRNPATVITKNFLVTRDIDILSAMAKEHLTEAAVSVTTLDAEVARVMEPRTAAPQRRLEAIRILSQAGIPTGVFVSPVIPGLTDHEIPSIVEAAAAAGASYACLQLVRLPGAVGQLFENWLARHLPDRKDKVLNRIREMHGGALNDPRFGHRMSGEGVFAEQIRAMFKLACRKAGLDRDGPELSTDKFRRPGDGQMSLFE